MLKAHVVTGLSISDIEYQLSLGAKVAEDGTIIPSPYAPPPTSNPSNDGVQGGQPSYDFTFFIITGAVLVITVLVIAVVVKSKKSS